MVFKANSQCHRRNFQQHTCEAPPAKGLLVYPASLFSQSSQKVYEGRNAVVNIPVKFLWHAFKGFSMMVFIKALLVGAFATQIVLSAHNQPLINRDVVSYIATEQPIALQGVLNNIGANGSKASGARGGVVVASPSTYNPDCK
jgi:hypothetical protein